MLKVAFSSRFKNIRTGTDRLIPIESFFTILQKSDVRMDLLYSSPLALTFKYLNRWFYKETPVRSLFKEFFEADRRNVDLGFDATKDEAEDYDFIVGKLFFVLPNQFQKKIIQDNAQSVIRVC